MDFLNMNLPPEDENSNKFPKLDTWFYFMNEQMEELEKVQQKGRINSLLFDNDIDLIE
jgi:hypothetical protein